MVDKNKNLMSLDFSNQELGSTAKFKSQSQNCHVID
jgi:hypothetical protein